MLGGLGLAGIAGAAQPAVQAAGLAAAWRDAFMIGVAVSNQTLDRQIAPHLDVIKREFNSVTAENAMKWGVIRPDGVNWQWDRSDRLVDFAAQNGMHVLGHTLVWHSQVPRSLFTDSAGTRLTRPALLARMEEHIATLVGRYKGRVHTWDVVNEALDEGNGWRRSQWLQIIGEDFMEQAFRMARKADPGAKLLYNDYNMHNPQKREFLVNVLRGYLDRGVPIDGVGLQGHLGLAYPNLEEWERSIAAYAAMGLEVHVTELDVDVLPSPNQPTAEISSRAEYSDANNPWPQGLPDEVQQRLADRYEQIFRILLRHRDRVERVTFWGLHDGMSWKNGFPVAGRTNYPLLLDRELKPKPAYDRLMQLARTEV
ncbi:MAG TPA: endo-1,4-beta-xylanase [Steroidobacteraceae bacterium]|nr:endo-1,4-beta-xylanase [Steroidobacteraceae bacterium]